MTFRDKENMTRFTIFDKGKLLTGELFSTENHRQTVECIPYADKHCLPVLVKLYHVESVGRDIMSGARECHYEEEGHAALEPHSRGNSKGYASQRCAYQELHEKNPPALGLQEINERTPQRLYHPRQSQPSGIESELCV